MHGSFVEFQGQWVIGQPQVVQATVTRPYKNMFGKGNDAQRIHPDVCCIYSYIIYCSCLLMLSGSTRRPAQATLDRTWQMPSFQLWRAPWVQRRFEQLFLKLWSDQPLFACLFCLQLSSDQNLGYLLYIGDKLYINDFAHIPWEDTPDSPKPLQRKKFLQKLLVKGPGYLPGVCG